MMNRPVRSLFSCALLLALSLAPLIARAQMPAIGGIISYQGQLSDDAGKPIADGTPSLTFKIYDGTTVVFEQTAPVATIGGVFNTFLSVGALQFDPAKAYELGITYNGVEVKHAIAAVPVAINAINATTATNATNFTGNLAGDVTGTQGATKVVALQSTAVSATAPTTAGQVLTYNGIQYAPATPAGATVTTDNTTITGNGSAVTPLAVKVPLALSGSLGFGTSILSAVNTGGGGGVSGSSVGSAGVSGYNNNYGGRYNGYGVFGYSNGPGYGVFGQGANGSVGVYGAGTQAGWFQGNVQVTGQLSASSKQFRIDHPLDPAGKYLIHTSVESPDMMNIYNGIELLDEGGTAIVAMPEYFSALNKEFRYQLTCIGGYAPVYVAEELANNHFKIAGGKAGMKVSWQITGIRQDAYANANRSPVELAKTGDERGHYLDPQLFGQSESKGIAALHQPPAAPQLAPLRN